MTQLNISYKITRTDKDPEAGDFHNITVKLNGICKDCNNLGFVKANDNPASYEYNDCECEHRHSPVIFLTHVHPFYQGPGISMQECLEIDIAEKIHDLIGEYTEELAFSKDDYLPCPDAFEQQYSIQDVLWVVTGSNTLREELINMTSKFYRCPSSIQPENCFCLVECSTENITVRLEQTGFAQTP